MSLSFSGVFGNGATWDANTITIPTDNLSVISGVSKDWTNGAEAVFAILEHIANETIEPLSSGNISANVVTRIIDRSKPDVIKKYYTFIIIRDRCR